MLKSKFRLCVRQEARSTGQNVLSKAGPSGTTFPVPRDARRRRKLVLCYAQQGFKSAQHGIGDDLRPIGGGLEGGAWEIADVFGSDVLR